MWFLAPHTPQVKAMARRGCDAPVPKLSVPKFERENGVESSEWKGRGRASALE